MLAGVLIRAEALPGPGTGDLTVWKVWSYHAARHGVGDMYGVGGRPPERRELGYAGATATVDYPPLALYELGIAGNAYWTWSHRHFPNATALNAFVKLPSVAGEIGLVLLMFVVVGREVGPVAARLTAAAYWLNPAALLDASILGYLDAQYLLPAVAALVAAAHGWPVLAGALIAAAVLTKAQGLFIARLTVWTFVHNASGLDGSAMCLTLPVWTRCLPVYGQIKSRDRRSVHLVTPSRPRLSVLRLRLSAFWVSLLNSGVQYLNASCIASCQMKPHWCFTVFTFNLKHSLFRIN